MAVAPTRAGPTLVGTSALAIFTAGGAGTYGILRSLHVTNETAGTVTVSIGINTAVTDAAGKRLFTTVSLPAGTVLDWSGFLPLLGSATTPDILYAISNTASGVAVTAGIITGP